MIIKTAEGDKSVGSAGVAGAGLGLGIAGTALALLNNNNCGGGILGNLIGGSGSLTHDSRVISALEAELAKEKAERYADSIGIATFKEAISLSNKNDDKINANYKELAQFIASLDKQIAVDRQATADNFAFLNNRIDASKKEVLCYCNATFVPGKLVMPLDNLCPEAMQRYNSWTAPTNSTTPSA